MTLPKIERKYCSTGDGVIAEEYRKEDISQVEKKVDTDRFYPLFK